MEVWPKCKTLQEAHHAAHKRRLAADLHSNPATPQQLMELDESEKAFEAIKAELESHQDRCPKE
jgi:hypothetical protein